MIIINQILNGHAMLLQSIFRSAHIHNIIPSHFHREMLVLAVLAAVAGAEYAALDSGLPWPGAVSFLRQGVIRLPGLLEDEWRAPAFRPALARAQRRAQLAFNRFALRWLNCSHLLPPERHDDLGEPGQAPPRTTRLFSSSFLPFPPSSFRASRIIAFSPLYRHPFPLTQPPNTLLPYLHS